MSTITTRTFAVLLVAAFVAVLGTEAGARTPASETKQAVRPTIVLVHGAWADGSSWINVTRDLQRDDYTVAAPPNPLRGLAADSASIAAYLSTISGPIVLVGHSYGGTVITNAALGNGQVKALVYVDAFIPAQHDTLLSLTQAGSCFAAPPPTVFDFVPIPSAPAGIVDAYVKPSRFLDCLASGLSKRKVAALAAAQRPLATNALTEESGVPAWATIPAWAVIGTEDHAITPASQLAMANRAKAQITKIDAPHLSMLSDPHAVARVIEQAAKATS